MSAPYPRPYQTTPPFMIQLAFSPAGAVGELLWHATPAPTATGAVILLRRATPAATPTISVMPAYAGAGAGVTASAAV